MRHDFVKVTADPEWDETDPPGTGHGVPIGTLGVVVGLVSSGLTGDTAADPLYRVRTLRHGEVALWREEFRTFAAPAAHHGRGAGDLGDEEDMNFGWALRELKTGCRVRRLDSPASRA